MHQQVSSRLKEPYVFSLSLLNVYLLLLEGKMLPQYRTPEFLNRISVRLLMNKLEQIPVANLPDLRDDEMQTLYAACQLGNRLFGSDKGDFICGMILQQIPQGHPLKNRVILQDTLQQHHLEFADFAGRYFGEDHVDFNALKKAIGEFKLEE